VAEACDRLVEKSVSDAIRQREVITRETLMHLMPRQPVDDLAEQLSQLRVEMALLEQKVDQYREQNLEASCSVEATKESAPASTPLARKKRRKEDTPTDVEVATEEKDIVEEFVTWRKDFVASVGKRNAWMADEIFVRATTDNRGQTRKLLSRKSINAHFEELRLKKCTLLKERNVLTAVETLYGHLQKATENPRPPRDGIWPVCVKSKHH